MGIVRYEKVQVYNLTFATNAYGETVTTETIKFESKPLVQQVKASLAITEKYRVYNQLINFIFNFTPYTSEIAENQNAYSIKWRDNDWRIETATESNDRLKITFMCYRNDPVTKV